MAQHDDRLETTAAGFAVVLDAVTELLRTNSATSAILHAYDDASDQIIARLRGDGIPDEQVQHVHKALSRLRLALEQRRP
jgi:hypothetical protein